MKTGHKQLAAKRILSPKGTMGLVIRHNGVSAQCYHPLALLNARPPALTFEQRHALTKIIVHEVGQRGSG